MQVLNKEILELLKNRKARVLLHACCAPCSSAVLEFLVNLGADCSVFYSNSNIYPEQEFDIRRNECIRYAEHCGVPIVVDNYDHTAWLGAVKGLEAEPERGSRCSTCFEFRLRRAAEYAAANSFDFLTTTLASSRWKSLPQVDSAGEKACADFPSVRWWGMNWRKGGLQDRRGQIIKEQNFYNQLYCGCEFSLRT